VVLLTGQQRDDDEGGAMTKSSGCIKGLGEVSIRVNDLEIMLKFYEEVIGLKPIRREESYVFFKIAEGYGGHTQNLALFDAAERSFIESKSPQLNQEETTLHHIALNVSLEDFDSEQTRLENLGIEVRVTIHEWLHVRSLHFSDPEGNLLEFVCYDGSLQ
jgi:catechol 2,3-dioxygenase-like lactoylglutathione lyase family enzyme